MFYPSHNSILYNFRLLHEDIEKEIPNLFSAEELKKLARKSTFVCREGNIDSSTFIRFICLNKENHRKESLNNLPITVRHEYDIKITKQSLHD